MAIGFNLSNKISGAGGAEVYIDNVQVVLNEIRLKTHDIMSASLPYEFNYGSAVVYNNEIHILGSGVSGNETKHYKWNGTSWTVVSTLPYKFNYGSAIVYNNEIHILGDYPGSGYSKNHYKWNGTNWTEVSTLPVNFSSGSAVVYNNELYILGGASSSTNYYKLVGTDWIFVSTLPYAFAQGAAVIYNNKIYTIGGMLTQNYTMFFMLNSYLVESMS